MQGSWADLKKFLPLILIFTLITILSGGLQMYSQSKSVRTLLQNFMGIFFIVFGTFKLTNLEMFAKSYRMYDLLAQQSKIYAYAYPFIEIGLGIAYLMRWQLVAINLITIIVMSVGAISVLRQLLAGRTVTCACLGALFRIPMTWVSFAEDALMIVMALFMLIY